MKQVILLIPISKNYYSVFYHGKSPLYIRDDKVNVLNSEQLDQLNKVIINNSYLKSVSFDKDSLDSALTEFEFQSPVTFVAGYKSGATSGAVKKKEIFYYKEDEKIMQSFESTRWLKYKSLDRNSNCLCGSQKKFKKCHMNEYSECKRMMDHIENNEDSRIYYVSEKSTIEQPIDEWYGYVPKENQKNK